MPTPDEAKDSQGPASPADMLAAGLSSDPGPTGGLPIPAGIPNPEQLKEDFPGLEVLAMLGRGGMGIVYKARQIALDRVVALKVIGGQAALHPQFAERFQREARAMARLAHPGIVTVYEFGVAPSGRHYLIMELIDGTNLREVMRAGRMTPAEALKIIPTICDALQFAHDEGIVHRDIKPENILIDRKGRVKIADFGLAKLLGPATPTHGLTDSNMAMGTPHYMAPEQFERPLEVDHRADVYALGVVLYEMLTGELPLGRFDVPSKKVEVDVRIDEVVLRALERDPQMRFQHVSEVKSGIESAGTAPVVQAPVAASSQPGERVWSRAALWSIPAQVIGSILLTKILLFIPSLFGFKGEIKLVVLAVLALAAAVPGAALALRGLLNIRDGGGRVRGATFAAAGVLFIPAMIVAALLCALARYLHGVLVSWLVNDLALKVALSFPALAAADNNPIVWFALGAGATAGLALIAMQPIRRYATPWIPRAARRGGRFAQSSAVRTGLAVLYEAAMVLLLIMGLSGGSQSDAYNTSAHVGAIQPWIVAKTTITNTGTAVTKHSGCELHPLSVSLLFFIVGAAMCSYHGRVIRRLGLPEPERRARMMRIFSGALMVLFFGAFLFSMFSNLSYSQKAQDLIQSAEPGQVRVPGMSEAGGASDGATSMVWSGPAQYSFEFVLTPPGGEAVVLNDWIVKTAQNGQAPGWGTKLEHRYTSADGETRVSIIYEGYGKDEFGPTDLWNVDRVHRPTGANAQEEKLSRGARYKGKELTIFDDEHGRLVLRPEKTD